ncbi:hypothetical protein LIS04_125 [Listeria phage LIS04]|nr:hypothetical protein LIS04_125 [Listeria phage LIS04]
MFVNENFPKWREASEILPELIAGATTLQVYSEPEFREVWLKHNFLDSIPDIDDYRRKIAFAMIEYIMFMRAILKVNLIYKKYENNQTVLNDPSILRDLIILEIKEFQELNGLKFKHDMANYVLNKSVICGKLELPLGYVIDPTKAIEKFIESNA